MKKLNLLILASLISMVLIAQQTSLNNIVTIKLPEGAERLSKEQLIIFIKNKQAYSQDRKNINGEIFKLNTMILQLIPLKGSVSKERLENLKYGLDRLAQMDGMIVSNYTSEIKVINNYRVLVIHDEGENWALYNFYSINNSGTCSVNGRLEYDKSDKTNREKAENILNTMLKTMHFKKD
jgi:hypothetical protein